MKIETKFNIGDIVRSKANRAMYGRIGGIYICSDGIKYNFYTINHGYMYLYENEIELIPKQILDDKEKKYLSTVIKPFRERIEGIIKISDCAKKKDWIKIYLIHPDEVIQLPQFVKNSMYKNMDPEVGYTLDKLEL